MITTIRRRLRAFFSHVITKVIVVCLVTGLVTWGLIAQVLVLVPTAVAAAALLFAKEVIAAIAAASDTPATWKPVLDEAVVLMGLLGAILGAPAVVVGIVGLVK